MTIKEDIISKARPPNDCIEIVLQIKMIIGIDELTELDSDYDFWLMMTDFSPPVEVIDAHMEVPKLKR